MSLNATLTTDWVQSSLGVTATSQAAGYPVTNLLDPEHPDIPWKSTSAGVHLALFDLGVARAVQFIALLYANFLTVQIWADDAPSFNSGPAGGPQYKSALLTLGRNPMNGRLCVYHIPASTDITPPASPPTVTRRHWGIVIPVQTPVTGIPNQSDYSAGFRLGAFLACPLTQLRNFRWDYDPTPTQEILIKKSLGGNTQTLVMGPEYGHLTGTRNALTRATTAGAAATELLDDGVAEWMDFERRWKVAGRALIAPSPTNKAWVALMRQVSVSRSVGIPVDEARFEWEEVA